MLAWLTDRRGRTFCIGRYSAWALLPCGAPQGCFLGPWPLEMFLDDLGHSFHPTHLPAAIAPPIVHLPIIDHTITAEIVVYACDVIVRATVPGITHLDEAMQPLFNAISEWTRAKGLPLLDRISFMAINNAGHHETPVMGFFRIAGRRHPCDRQSHKILGVTVDSLLTSFEEDVRRRRARIQHIIFCRNFMCGRRHSTRVRSYAWAAGQILLHGCGVRTLSHAHTFSVVTVVAMLGVGHQGGCGTTQQCGNCRHPSGQFPLHTGGLRASKNPEGRSNLDLSAGGIGGPSITSLYPLQYCVGPFSADFSAFLLPVRIDRFDIYLLVVQTTSKGGRMAVPPRRGREGRTSSFTTVYS
ncbi:peptide hydrolase [Trypanosoma cruzi]|nr:peptide hydrolase [Trypanosoma cruzi]